MVLDQVLENTAVERENLWLLTPMLSDSTALTFLNEAQTYFQAAAQADPHNAQAQRWLGRVALLRGKPLQAVEHFSDVVQLRPDNPLGYWELGLAYERLMEYQVETVYWMFTSAKASATSSLKLTWTPTETATLRSATLRTPPVTIETPYCEAYRAIRAGDAGGNIAADYLFPCMDGDPGLPRPPVGGVGVRYPHASGGRLSTGTHGDVLAGDVAFLRHGHGPCAGQSARWWTTGAALVLVQSG
ncbi:MAG: hypothetical protein U9Q70_01775 [Chloroflexota bacterium]|nr:hypothetical protein [Chloroflexota bacterium]